MSVFDTNNKKGAIERNMFLDGEPDIARYDLFKYKSIDKLTEKMLSFFWTPQEIDVTMDKNDFKKLTDHGKHIFTSNLKRQILLDSIQGRGPNLALLPICSLPELETAIETWSFGETIHSRSYTHIIRNIYANPSLVFDSMLDIPEITACARDISKYYDKLIVLNNEKYVSKEKLYKHKKAIWMCLHAINALEGIRFYVSFACSWGFAELKQMEGNAKIIKFICRDENVHLALTNVIIKNLVKEDPDYAEIKEECKEDVIELFTSVNTQEKQWADYLFKDGSMIGLNAQLLKNYVDFITLKRAKVLGLKLDIPNVKQNPLPWTEKWIGQGGNIQVAPQEVELSSYITGGIDNNLDPDELADLEL